MRIILAAFNDIAQARDWYEKRRTGLGREFVEKVDETLSRIERSPLVYPQLVNDARRANMERFPYGVWFKADEEPVVIACLHHRRNPMMVKGRGPK